MEQDENRTKHYWRKTLLDESNVEWKDLEKILLAVVGATLAASVTFFTDNENLPYGHTLLKLAWILLGTSLFSLLMSYAVSEWFSSNLLTKIKDDEREYLSEEDIEDLKSESLRKGIEILNYISLATAVFGVGFLTAFGYFNI